MTHHPTTVAVDLSMTVFEIGIADRQWRLVERRRLDRWPFARFLAEHAVTHVVREAQPRVFPEASDGADDTTPNISTDASCLGCVAGGEDGPHRVRALAYWSIVDCILRCHSSRVPE